MKKKILTKVKMTRIKVAVIISWIFLSKSISAQTFHDIPDYPNQESIEKELSRLFSSTDLSFLVYQPDILSYRNLNDEDPMLDKFIVDDSIYSIIFVSGHSPNCMVFLGDHATKMLTLPHIDSFMHTLSTMDSVWVDNEEAALKVIAPWMIPAGNESVIFNQAGLRSCFQLPNEQLNYKLEICFDLKLSKQSKREYLVGRIREFVLWAFLEQIKK